MNRRSTMSRFKEPDDAQPVANCDFCGGELYKGDTVYKFDSDTYCKTQCVADAYCRREVLGE